MKRLEPPEPPLGRVSRDFFWSYSNVLFRFSTKSLENYQVTKEQSSLFVNLDEAG